MNSVPYSEPVTTRAPASAQGVWMAVYVAVVVGKFSEWVPGLGSIPLAKIAIILTAVFAYRAREQLLYVRVRSLPIARPALVFLALAILSTVYSVYKSESLSTSYGIAVCLLSFVVLVKITQTTRDLQRLLIALCVAAGALAVAVLLTYSGGRARINQNFDPNDLAYGLVTVLPVTRVLVATTNRGRWLLNVLTVAMVLAVVFSGSRGGALGLGVITLLIVAFPLGYTASGELKTFHFGRLVAVLAVLAVLGVAAWSYLPRESRAQLTTLVDLQNDYNVGSYSGSRLEIWKRDSVAVLYRPIGFGVGSFEYVDSRLGGAYRAPHNSFVEALVELGVPGLILLCGCYLSAIKQLGRVTSLGRHTAPAADSASACLYARALRIALAGNIVCGFFLSQAYSPLLWLVMAICTALVRISIPSFATPDSGARRA